MSRPAGADRTRVARTPSPTRRLVLVAVTLTTTLAALVGTGALLPPPPFEPRLDRSLFAGWDHWLQQMGPAGALMALIRLGALALTGYLLLVVTLELLALVSGQRLIGAGASLMVAPWARRLVRGAAGLGVATSIVAATLGSPYLPATLSPSAGALAVGADLAPTMHRLDLDPTSTSSSSSTEADPPPTMRRLDPDPPETDPPSTLPPSTLPPSTLPPSTLPPSTTPPSLPAIPTDPSPVEPRPTWTIAPGDHLWGVAAHTLTSAWGRSPSDAEVDRYLGRLIAQNRSVLTVPDDPDLVLPGQVFVLVSIPT